MSNEPLLKKYSMLSVTFNIGGKVCSKLHLYIQLVGYAANKTLS